MLGRGRREATRAARYVCGLRVRAGGCRRCLPCRHGWSIGCPAAAWESPNCAGVVQWVLSRSAASRTMPEPPAWLETATQPFSVSTAVPGFVSRLWRTPARSVIPWPISIRCWLNGRGKHGKKFDRRNHKTPKLSASHPLLADPSGLVGGHFLLSKNKSTTLKASHSRMDTLGGEDTLGTLPRKINGFWSKQPIFSSVDFRWATFGNPGPAPLPQEGG